MGKQLLLQSGDAMDVVLPFGIILSQGWHQPKVASKSVGFSWLSQL